MNKSVSSRLITRAIDIHKSPSSSIKSRSEINDQDKLLEINQCTRTQSRIPDCKNTPRGSNGWNICKLIISSWAKGFNKIAVNGRAFCFLQAYNGTLALLYFLPDFPLPSSI